MVARERPHLQQANTKCKCTQTKKKQNKNQPLKHFHNMNYSFESPKSHTQSIYYILYTRMDIKLRKQYCMRYIKKMHTLETLTQPPTKNMHPIVFLRRTGGGGGGACFSGCSAARRFKSKRRHLYMSRVRCTYTIVARAQRVTN